ncbi:hypothetical protein DJ527_11655 [Sulfolobus sp. F1]|nr:hypothetical protein DJ527_11655 [Sulfolobus sp. F1]
MGRNFLKDILVYVEYNGQNGIFIHCVGDCIKGTGCVVYEVKDSMRKDDIKVEELNLTPLFVTSKAYTALHSLLEASKKLGIEKLEEAFNIIMDKVSEGKFLEWDSTNAG